METGHDASPTLLFATSEGNYCTVIESRPPTNQAETLCKRSEAHSQAGNDKGKSAF